MAHQVVQDTNSFVRKRDGLIAAPEAGIIGIKTKEIKAPLR
jgi:hypothetical protein